VQRALSLTLVQRHFVDPSLPAALLADASEAAMMVGALLLQPNRDTEDPVNDPPEFWWIVQVIQKQLNRYQQRWAVIVKELFGVVTGIGEFRETMQVCKRRFVLSDHEPLKHLARSKLWGKLSPVQQRLMTVILSLNAKWLYCPGPKSQIADVTSRWRLVHKPEGSQLIPVPMRTGEALQPGKGLTAPLMDRLELGETLHARQQESKDEAVKVHGYDGNRVGVTTGASWSPRLQRERSQAQVCWTSWVNRSCRSTRSWITSTVPLTWWHPWCARAQRTR
jgi:hypothetical protein